MNEPITASRTRPRRRSVLRVAVFLTATAYLLLTIVYFASERRATQQAAASLQAVHDQLHPIADRLEKGRRQAEIDRRVAVDLLGLCRTVDDMPEFGGNHIIARHEHAESLYMYVPDGKHTLEISTSWNPIPSSWTPEGAAGSAAADPSQPAGEKVWNVPLLASSGYWRQVTNDRGTKRVQWELQGNHPQFETRADVIPLDDFVQQGASWSGATILQLANQVAPMPTQQLEAAIAAPPGVELMDVTWRGRRQQQMYKIGIAVRLRSDAPACVTATDTQRLIILGQNAWSAPHGGGDDLLGPYRGGGRYELRRAADGAGAAASAHAAATQTVP